jgi:transcriptional regulator with XRE-family HTH domain
MPREMFYFRQRFRNRVYNRMAAFFAREAEERGITKKVIAERLGKDPAQITRWLSGPANLTMDTLSDLLFAMEAEPEPPRIVKWADKPKPNYFDPLIAEILGMPVGPQSPPTSVSQSTDSTASLFFDTDIDHGKIFSNEPVL